MCTPPPPRDDPPLSNATGILHKKNVVSSGHQSVTPFLSGAPLLKKSLDPPLCYQGIMKLRTSAKRLCKHYKMELKCSVPFYMNIFTQN